MKKSFIDIIRKLKYEYYEKNYCQVIQVLVHLSDEDLNILRDLINEEYDWRYGNVRRRTNFTDTVD